LGLIIYIIFFVFILNHIFEIAQTIDSLFHPSILFVRFHPLLFHSLIHEHYFIIFQQNLAIDFIYFLFDQ